MLKPALLYKYEIKQKSIEYFYTDDYLNFVGRPDNHPIEVFDSPGSGFFQFASVDKDNNLIGFISFKFDHDAKGAYNFGIISFVRGTFTFARDLRSIVDLIVNRLHAHRIEWRCVEGNPVKKGYDKFCKRYNGTVHHLKDVFRDYEGNYRDAYIYEIIFDN